MQRQVSHMGDRRFRLSAQIRTTERAAAQARLSALLPQSAITPTEEGVQVEGEMEGTSARELNRRVLSALRQIDRRTTLRAEWTTANSTERFFDYVPKGVRPAQVARQAEPSLPEEER